jgi:V/A-type H+/Na+-transporting ATPase subunit E
VNRSDSSSHEVLREEILADAVRQAERLVRKAEREAKALVAKATDESEQERRQKLAAAAATAERQRILTLATVPIEIARAQAARVEQELLGLREQVRQRLRTRQGFAYGEVLARLAAEAVARMDGDRFVLELSEEDLPKFGAALTAAVPARAGRPQITLTLSDAPAKIEGGVIVRDPQGRQVWDNSFAARLDRLWPQLRNQIAQYLGLDTRAERSGGQS